MQKTLLIIVLLCSVVIHSQTLNGKVFDATATAKGAKVTNLNQNVSTRSNQNGVFKIKAKINDSLFFESLFHHPKTVVLTKVHFENTAIFELKKIVNELDEVIITEVPIDTTFEEEVYTKELQQVILNDIKNNPHLYNPKGTYEGVDFIYLFSQLFKLFKRNKHKAPVYPPIKYKQLDSLFTNSKFFNKQLLTNDLNIPKDKIALFMEFCDAKQMSSELLLDKNRMDLLENLVQNSTHFLEILEEFKKQKE